MAETTEPAAIEVTDSDLFKAATAPEPAPAAETPPPHPKDESRDVHGRFRQKADQQQPSDPPAPPPPPSTPIPGSPPTPGTPTPPPPQDDANVPSWRLREEREQREMLARQLQERDYALQDMRRRMEQFERSQKPETPQELPDPLIDPQGYRHALEGKFQSDLRQVQLENNLQLNRLQHGPVFDEAYAAFMQAAQGDQGFARLIVNSPNPGSAMVSWYKRAVTLAKVGDDPDKYVEAEIERRFSDPKFVSALLERARAIASGQAPAPPGTGAAPRQNNVTQIPPSLSRIPSGSPTETAVEAVRSLDDGELFRQSLPPKRNKG